MITMPIEGGLRVKLSIWNVCYDPETSLVKHAIGMRACLIMLLSLKEVLLKERPTRKSCSALFRLSAFSI